MWVVESRWGGGELNEWIHKVVTFVDCVGSGQRRRLGKGESAESGWESSSSSLCVCACV